MPVIMMRREVLAFQVTPEIAHKTGVFFFRDFSSEVIWARGLEVNMMKLDRCDAKQLLLFWSGVASG